MEPTVTASIWSCGDLGWCVSRGGGAHLRARGRPPPRARRRARPQRAGGSGGGCSMAEPQNLNTGAWPKVKLSKSAGAGPQGA